MEAEGFPFLALLRAERNPFKLGLAGVRHEAPSLQQPGEPMGPVGGEWKAPVAPAGPVGGRRGLGVPSPGLVITLPLTQNFDGHLRRQQAGDE